MRRTPNRVVALVEAHKRIADDPIPMRDAVRLVDIVKRLSGIHMDPGNSGFLRLRVNRRLRERAHYDFLRTTGLPNLLVTGAGRDWPLLVWSAACSIGSELWSAGIVLDQFSHTIPGGMRWSLLGTDVSGRVLARARNAAFTEQNLAGLSAALRHDYLLRSIPGVQTAAGGPVLRVVKDLRDKARFEWANLVDMPQEPSVRVDVAFLRNVLIYFKQTQKDAAVRNVLRHIRPGGYLFTGHADTFTPLPDGLGQFAPSVHRKAHDED